MLIVMNHRRLWWLLLLILACSSTIAQLPNLNVVSEWKELEYEFCTVEDKQAAIDSGTYIPGNGVPIDVAVHYIRNNGRIFVTVPRFKTGIPITLTTISDKQGHGGPLLTGYPNWSMNQDQYCNGIISVFRVAIDECERLWVLDTGRIVDKQVCPPQLLVFNLRDDKLILKYQIPNDLYKSDSLFITLVVDVRNTAAFCADTMVYISDVQGFGILVYSNLENVAWRFNNKLTFPNPDFGTFTIAGESFDQMDGIFGMALTPKGSPNRQLFFHALASSSENRVPLSFLDNPNNVNLNPRAFVEIGKRGMQTTAEAMDQNGNLFFGLISPIAVGCWDSSQAVYDTNRIRVVVQNNETLQFSSGLKVVMNYRRREELWVLTCRFQRVMSGTLSPTEVNFRIQALPIDQILDGSNSCLSAGRSLDTY